MDRIVNMTPHPIIILDEEDQEIARFESVGQIRLAVETVPAAEIDGIKTSVTKFGDPVGLPNFEEGTYYIVSQLVKSALPDRDDLLVPADVVRDETGRIVGCRSLGR